MVVTGVPSTVAVAVTTTSAAETDTARVVKAWLAVEPGARAATVLVPAALSIRRATGTSSAFVARTVTTTFPAMHRVAAAAVTSSDASFRSPRRPSCPR